MAFRVLFATFCFFEVAAKVCQQSWMNTADPPGVRAQKLLDAMNITEKISMLHGNGHMMPYVGAVNDSTLDQLGIPALYLNDGPQGFRDNNGLALMEIWLAATMLLAAIQLSKLTKTLV